MPASRPPNHCIGLGCAYDGGNAVGSNAVNSNPAGGNAVNGNTASGNAVGGNAVGGNAACVGGGSDGSSGGNAGSGVLVLLLVILIIYIVTVLLVSISDSSRADDVSANVIASSSDLFSVGYLYFICHHDALVPCMHPGTLSVRSIRLLITYKSLCAIARLFARAIECFSRIQ